MEWGLAGVPWLHAGCRLHGEEWRVLSSGS